MRYEVTADVKYLDGALAGLLIPNGQRVTFPTLVSAIRHQQFLARVRDSGDFVRAIGTGNKYQVVGSIRVDLLDVDDAGHALGIMVDAPSTTQEGR